MVCDAVVLLLLLLLLPHQGTVVAFYNGVRVANQVSRPQACSRSKGLLILAHLTFQQDDYKLSAFRVRLNEEADLDIPPHLRSLKEYCASLAHKLTHSFRPNCELDLFEHPRFGLVLCAAAARDVRRGEELSLHYGLPLHRAPLWYKEQWLTHRQRRGANEEEQEGLGWPH